MLCWLFWVVTAPAQEPHLAFQRLTMADGLAQFTVNAVAQDQTGFMWFGTQDGLSRFDGYQMRTYRYERGASRSLSDNFIHSLTVSPDGTLWIGTGNGFNRYDADRDQFQRYVAAADREGWVKPGIVHALSPEGDAGLWVSIDGGGLSYLNRSQNQLRHFPPEEDNGLPAATVFSFAQDRKNRLWLGMEDGHLAVYDRESARFRTYSANNPDYPRYNVAHDILDIYEKEGFLWLATDGGGLVRFDPGTVTTETFRHQPENTNSLPSDRVYSVTSDGWDVLWVGTYGGGLCRLDLAVRRFKTYQYQSEDTFSLSHNDVEKLYRDREGLLWIATYGNGVNRFNPHGDRFKILRKQQGNAQGLASSEVRALHEDGKGRIWIGTRLGLHMLDPDTRQLTHYPAEPEKPEGLNTARIDALYADPAGIIWIATDGGGLNRLDPADGRFTHYKHDPYNPQSISHNQLRSLAPAEDGRIWVGTLAHGLNLFDPGTGTFERFNHDPDRPDSLAGDRVHPILQEENGTLWVGTLNGFNRRLPGTAAFETYRSQQGKPDTISHNRITCFYRDRDGVMWIGTQGGGINQVVNEEPGALRFRAYTTEDGLAADAIGGILQDRQGRFWISTTRGVSCFDPAKEHFQNYSRPEGAQGTGYFINSFLADGRGLLYFGGITGLSVFNPDDFKPRTAQPRTTITDFFLANQPVPLRFKWSQSPLRRPIYLTESVTLDHNFSVFSFRFSSLTYNNPAAHRYRYKMEGLDQQWIETTATNRYANYNRIPHGNYTFRVQAGDKEGNWDPVGAVVAVRILPPWWRSWWAMSLYFLASLFLVGAFLQFQNNKLKREREIALREREVAHQLRQVATLKDEFLANTSHELRTPLNGIIGIAESLIDGVSGPINGDAESNLQMIVQSGRRLANLVNDILDFSQLRKASLELRRQPLDLYQQLNSVMSLSKPLIGSKNLVLKNLVEPGAHTVLADYDRLQQILHNLIGNAIKFTESGSIRTTAERRDDQVVISVIDTGIGIAPADQERIFESFEQADGSASRHYSGTGLGLAVTRQLVALHEGRIWIESEPGRGANFSFTLPASDQTAVDIEAVAVYRPMEDGEDPSLVSPDAEVPVFDTDTAAEPRLEGDTGRFHILVVDDEPVNRQVLTNHLAFSNYQITQASSGSEALELIGGDTPFDLILLDVMMPQMNGYQVCRNLRQNYSVQDLPVLLLTAKNRIDDLVEGFSVGANDYITKPISKAELISRVETQLKLLDIHRNLEQKVQDRTQALEIANQELVTRNDELNQKNRELETLDQIVNAINREIMLESLLEAILEKGFLLFPQAEKGALLMRRGEDDQFHIARTHGYDQDEIQALVFDEKGVWERYTSGEQKEEGVWLLRDAPRLPGWENMDHLPRPRCMLSMSLNAENRLEGFLILDNFTKDDAFDQITDLGKLKRFREHATSAVNKARYVRSLEETTRQLVSTRRDLVDAAHKAGMAEIAVGVLHNIGNTLNSVTTSASLLQDYLREPKPMKTLNRLATLMESHRHDLIDFLVEAKKGDVVPPLIIQATKHMTNLLNQISNEAMAVRGGVERITEFVRAHNEYTHISFNEEFAVNQLVEEVVNLQRGLLDNRQVILRLELGRVPNIVGRRQMLSQVLTHLLFNALDAVRSLEQQGVILVSTSVEETLVRIEIHDNGMGIDPEALVHIFSHGFTTKKSGQGYGLHFCANAVNAMGGKIWAESDGKGKGSKFMLCLPLKAGHRLDEAAPPIPTEQKN
ncbi:ATP-binding protein [Acanthopleuribacter pedis]|uniref:histidine kinase n=1 Tax=Acanthopleuribacter pedis TaxID=442870 RepID=A0A8J7QIV2_9BACT|nr:ATP-binding protein [Acanthopleuribacter pedis]MBO1321581.1 response regulator [Acanthopleuribacter pedis]